MRRRGGGAHWLEPHDEQRTYAAASDPRALHASCGGTGEKWVLAKFLRAAPLSAGDRAEL